MTKLVLFTYPGACSRVAMAALEETGAAHEVKWVNLGANAQLAEDYLAVNYKGKVPALAVDGTVLTENPAILHFLHTTYAAAKLLPQGETPLDQARILSDLAWCSATLHPIVRQIRASHRYTKGETAGIVTDGREKLAKECAHMNHRLSASEWWYGREWSIADLYLHWITNTAARSGFPVSDYPAITAHAQQVRARPSFQRVLAKELAAIARDGLPVDPADL